MTAALDVVDLAVSYGHDRVIEGVRLDVDAGDAIALIGPNGAGKTTLIRAILGLAPVVAGRIEVLGTDPESARPDVAYVPQAEALDPDFPVTVAQVVMMGRYRQMGWVRRPKQTDREAVADALAEVDLTDRAADRFGVLSGGQRQRVLIARALAQQPRLLLLDEPFNGVDGTTTDIVVQVLARLRSEGAAIVMSTHDLAIAHLTCDDACLLNRHQVAWGPIGETLTPDRLQATYGASAVVLAGSLSHGR